MRGPNGQPLRVLFCGCAGLFSALALRRLMDSADLEVVAVVRSTRILRPDYGFLMGAWHQIRRSGIAYATYLWVATAWTETLSQCSLGRLTRRHRIPVLATRDINDRSGRAFVAAARPNLLISAFFNQHLGPAVLALAQHTGLNIHPSLLPNFKGVDPVFFARLRGASRLGVTVHRLATEFDAGDILRQHVLPTGANESLFRTTAGLFDLGARLLTGHVAATGDLVGAAQRGQGSYDSWPSAAEVGQLHRQGVTLMRLRDLEWALRGAP